MTLLYAFIFMLYVPLNFTFTFHSIFHLCSLEHLLSYHFYFAHLSFFFLLLRHLIINVTIKTLMLLGLLGYYPWHFGDCELLGLRIRSPDLPWNLVTSIVILSGVLGVYPKTLVCLSALCEGYCEDLIHLKFGSLKRSSIFAFLVSI